MEAQPLTRRHNIFIDAGDLDPGLRDTVREAKDRIIRTYPKADDQDQHLRTLRKKILRACDDSKEITTSSEPLRDRKGNVVLGGQKAAQLRSVVYSL